MSDLNTRMEFDRVIHVDEHGTVTDAEGIYAPEVHADGLDVHLEGDWSLMDGYSGQDLYSGPIMHASEFVGGRMARDILETPGYYVAVVVYPMDDGEPDGWAVAYRRET